MTAPERGASASGVSPITAGRRAAVLARMPGARRIAPAALGAARVPWPERARVLVIKPDHLGDVLLAGPAIAHLRARRPADEITLLVGPWSRDVARGLPGPDEIASFPFPSFTRIEGRRWPGFGYARLLRLAHTIRRGRWDAVLVLRDDDYVSAWAAALAGVPLRLGHSEPGVTPFLTHALPASDRPAHVTAAGIALVRAAVGGSGEGAAGREAGSVRTERISPAGFPLAFHLRRSDELAAERLLGPLAELGQLRGPGLDAPGPIAIHPGAGADIKRWTAARWARVVRTLCAPGEPLILTGSAGERPLTAAIARLLAETGNDASGEGHPVLDLAGRTDIGALAALYARCRLVLGPDSGPLHLAAAVGTPSVHILGPADPARFGPWGLAERHRVVMSDLPCAPCGRLDWPDPGAHPCVRSVPSRAVIAAAEACERLGPTL